MTQPGQSISVRLRMDIAEWVSGARRVTAETARMASQGKRDMNELGSAIDKAARAEKLDNVAHAATGVGIALGGAFTYIVAQAAQFEKAMSEVNSVNNEGAASMERLEKAALAAGAATQYSATQAAKAEAELLRAGLSVNDVVGGALGGALSLAAAGQLDLGEAATVTAKALNTFDLSGADSTHVADVLAAAANKSATDVHELGVALKQGGLSSSQMGVSLEETAGTLALFANNALAGSDGGTSFKTMLQFLAAPSEKAKAAMDELGISAFDAGGKFVGIAGLADQLQAALGGLTQAEQQKAVATIFGADASRAANILLREGGDAVREFTAAVDDQGAAAETAAKLTDNLAGDYERLKGSVETFAVGAGGGGTEGLRTLTQGAKALVDQLGAIPAPITSATVVAAGLTAGALLLFAAFVKGRGAVAAMSRELEGMGPAGGKASKALQATTKWGARVGGVFAGLQIVGAIAGTFNTTATDVDTLAASLKNLADQKPTDLGKAYYSNKDADGLERLKKDIESLKRTGDLSDINRGSDIENTFGIGNLYDNTITNKLERITALNDALAQLATSNPVAAEKSFNDLAKNLGLTGEQIEYVKSLMPDYTSALAKAKTEADGNAIAAAAAGDRNKVLAAGMSEAAEEGKTLIQTFEDLNNAELNYSDAKVATESALDALADGFKNTSKALTKEKDDFNLANDAGRANYKLTTDVIRNAAKQAQAEYDRSGSIEKGTQVYAGYIKQLRERLRQEGLAPAVIDAILERYGKMPTLLGESETAAASLNSYLTNLPTGASFTFDGTSIVDASGKAVDLGVNLEGLPVGKTFHFDGTSIVDASGKVYTLDEAIKGIPPEKDVHIGVRASGVEDLRYIHDTVANLSDKTVNIAMNITGNRNPSAARDAIAKQYAAGSMDRGGIRSYAGGGVDPGIYTGVGDGMIKFAEASTIKEGYLPYSQRGTQRNRSILAELASWEKMRLVPMARGGITAAANGLVTSGGTEAFSGSRADFNRAQLSGLDSIKSLTDALKENGKAFSMNTQKGRDNQKAVVSLLDSAKSAAEAKYAETGSYVQANRVYDQYIARLEKILRIRGASAAQAKRLVRDLQNRPEYAAPEATKPKTGFDYASYTSALGGAEESIGSLQDTLSLNKATLSYKDPAGRDNLAAITNAIKAASDAANERYSLTGDLKSSRKIFNDYIAQLRKSLLSAGFSSSVASSIIKRYAKGVNVTKNALGGLYPDDAGVYSGGATIHGFAEQATGRELFLPQQGISQQKASRLLQVGAGWHGMDVSPRGTGTGSSTSNTYHLNLNPRTANMNARDLAPVMRDIEIRSRVGWPK